MLNQSIGKPLLLWGLANMFFAFQFILRLSAGILREDIIQKFQIDVASFGTLAGYYYLGYAGMQIPLGIMLDQMSFRIVTFLAIITASIGTLIFVWADNWHYLLLGRLLIGAGSGVAFLAVAKVTKTYFQEKYHSLMLGFSFTFGLTGAVFGAAPMRYLFNHFGYDNTFYALAAVGFGIALLMLSPGKIKKDRKSEEELGKRVLAEIVALIINPRIILVGVCGGLMVGSLEGFADVWAIAYFNQVYGMSQTQSTLVTSFVYIGMCVGGPILAIAAGLVRSPNFMIFITGILTISVFAILFFVPSMSIIAGASLMFGLGILCCYQVLVFTVVSSYVPVASAGMAIALTNCINMSFGHLFHSVIGNIIQAKWGGEVNDIGIALYSRETFIIALAVIPVCCFIGQFGFAYLAIKKRY
jgi:predicted MFS family arabinose efflux permease